MQSPRRSLHKTCKDRIRLLLIALIITGITLPMPSALAEAVGDRSRRALDQVFTSLKETPKPSLHSVQEPFTPQAESPTDRAMRVTDLKVCPQRLVLYTGEAFTLSALPVDRTKQDEEGKPETVQGAGLTWESSDSTVAGVTNWGEVEALNPGRTTITVSAGVARENVLVEVREGGRPQKSDLEWEFDRSNDCDESRATGLGNTPPGRFGDYGAEAAKEDGLQNGRSARLSGLRKASLRVQPASARPSFRAAASVKTVGRSMPLPLDPLDGDGEDTFALQATQFYNAVGNGRFTPQEAGGSGPTKTKRDLGSYNYFFSAPVLGLGGRGVGVSLALSYNSRVWNKDGNQMTFNLTKGWPAAGWTLGYGRILKNYDNTGAGDKSGLGFPNAPGNFLLVQGDGTRTHLAQYWDSVDGVYKHKSEDGTFLHLTYQKKLRYPDGTNIKYDEVNNRLLPTNVKTTNGDMITIAYKNYCNGQGCSPTFKVRWAINYITDTLGRVIQFNYDPTTFALTSITAPDFAGGTRTLVRLDYQNITLNYNFGSMTVVGPTNLSQLTVLRRIYYPQTGRGYLFLDYSTYGIARRISMRKDMTGAGGTVTDGTEIAYTKFYYTTIDPSDPYGRHQMGTLNDSPQYTKREEWWQSKTDDLGNPDNNPSIYNYSRSTGSGTEIDTVTHPNNLQVVTTTDNNSLSTTFGTVISTELKNVSTVLRKTAYTYVAGADGGWQVGSVETFDEANQPTKTSYTYGNYGRVKDVKEYGYKVSGSYGVRRRTFFNYIGDTALIDLNMVRLVNNVKVYDGGGDNNDNNDTLLAWTVYTYDNYAIKGGMETYGLIPTGYPVNHDSGFDQNKTTRGNVTGVQTYSNVGTGASTTRYNKYDIFGNIVEADVSCCVVKAFGFSNATYYSQPDWARDGNAAGPNLTTSYLYNFNTGLVTRVTDPDGLQTNFQYDSAWRLSQVTAPSGAFTTTAFDKDSNLNDQLAYSEKANYTDTGGVSKIITTKSWFDGAGRTIRSGTGAGSSPSSYDAVKTVYDFMGRVARQSNPYTGDSSGNGSPAYWTVNTYDMLSRVTVVTLPDSQTIQTAYSGGSAGVGASVIVTDQVGRKRKSEVDGLGRVVKVTEQNPATGALDPTNYLTTYTYDVLDNLKQVNQGGQLRTFQYDSLSRLTSETTPEGGTLTYTYTSFNAINTRTDPRGVLTTFGYDGLNRLSTISYNTASAPGVLSTPGSTITYRTTSPGKGQLNSVTNAVGNESYLYDSLGRVSSKTRLIDSRSYTTSYTYNTASQPTILTYPSGKRVRVNRDTRGRMSGIDKVDGAGNFLSSYASAVGYNVTGQVTGITLGNGVVESYGYNAQRLQLTSQSATKGAATLLSLTYGYAASAGASGTSTTAGNSGQLMSITGTVNNQNRAQILTSRQYIFDFHFSHARC